MFLFNYHLHNPHCCETKGVLSFSQFINRQSISKHKQPTDTSKIKNPAKVLEYKTVLKTSTTSISTLEMPQSIPDPRKILTDLPSFQTSHAWVRSRSCGRALQLLSMLRDRRLRFPLCPVQHATPGSCKQKGNPGQWKTRTKYTEPHTKSPQTPFSHSAGHWCEWQVFRSL